MPAACLNRCKPDFLIRFGEPGEEILKTATACGANLIVLRLRLPDKRAGYLLPQWPTALRARLLARS